MRWVFLFFTVDSWGGLWMQLGRTTDLEVAQLLSGLRQTIPRHDGHKRRSGDETFRPGISSSLFLRFTRFRFSINPEVTTLFFLLWTERLSNSSSFVWSR